MSYAILPEVRLHYQLDGKPGSPVLVMSNSLGTNFGMWDEQIPRLTEHFRVLRYDTRGHGKSEVASGPYRIDMLGSDVIDLLDHLGIKKAHFCGLSMGGITGMWLAVSYPERIDRLILCNTSAYIGPPSNWTARIEKVLAEGMGSIAPAVVGRWLTPAFAEKNPELVERLLAMLNSTPAEGYAANCCAVRDADLRDAVKEIKSPTLVISGSGDLPTPPADSAYLVASIAGAKGVELEAAHISNFEQPEQFTAAVLDFLLN